LKVGYLRWIEIINSHFFPSENNFAKFTQTLGKLNYSVQPCNFSNALIRTSNKLPISSLPLITRIDLKAFPFGRFDLIILPSSSRTLVSNAVGFSIRSIIIGSNPALMYSAVSGGHAKVNVKCSLSILVHYT